MLPVRAQKQDRRLPSITSLSWKPSSPAQGIKLKQRRSQGADPGVTSAGRRWGIVYETWLSSRVQAFDRTLKDSGGHEEGARQRLISCVQGQKHTPNQLHDKPQKIMKSQPLERDISLAVVSKESDQRLTCASALMSALCAEEKCAFVTDTCF